MNLIEQLKRDEGLELEAYPDPLTGGEPYTIGYGHTGGVQLGDTVTLEQAHKILLCDISKCAEEVLEHIHWAHTLDEVRFCVLVNMCFNLGINGLLKFKNTLKCIECSDYKQASIEMLKSKWAKQVGRRAIRLARQIESGEWQ